MKIRCKIDCYAVDCKDCAEKKKDAEDTIQGIRDDIGGAKDKETMFDNLQSTMFLREHCDELINICKNKLRSLGVTIPEET